MIISRLHNDVLKKREFWVRFAKSYGCDFSLIQTPLKDVNKLNISFLFQGVKVNFLETDAKPLVCEFEVNTDRKINIEIGPTTMFDWLYSLFKKRQDAYTNSFFIRNKVKSDDRQILSAILKDNDLLSLLNSSEFFNLYAYTERSILKVRITCTYFVSSYEKLVNIYLIVNKIIGHLRGNASN